MGGDDKHVVKERAEWHLVKEALSTMRDGLDQEEGIDLKYSLDLSNVIVYVIHVASTYELPM